MWFARLEAWGSQTCAEGEERRVHVGLFHAGFQVYRQCLKRLWPPAGLHVLVLKRRKPKIAACRLLFGVNIRVMCRKSNFSVTKQLTYGLSKF